MGHILIDTIMMGFLTLVCSWSVGFINTDLYHQWFIKIFLAKCGSVRPVLLIMDNHDAHINLHTIKAAIENDVVLLGLPVHTTQILQPLDVKVIGPLKVRFSKLAKNIWHIASTVTLGKAKFPIVLHHAIDQASPASIREAFRQVLTSVTGTSAETCPTCGVFRVNPLVAQELIPESLGHILVPPRMSPMQAKRRKSKLAY
ncbi:LOW QUALITY PROTEIN: hypothetical protein MAR_034129 [Mya arenaria]|uniref:DDE-1 domain-containing protein n=1 Tax=Mya arenaria TaxID=6604 RepID=A0ABY7GE16_MYAAR|nr:LOW QUALITY PROTEIN: hypothetical protein MAR_034129 [Mya arenaria]